ncbi:JmjC domain, hydroxylase-domain-containing protein, partial [Baffinella frigidus]
MEDGSAPGSTPPTGSSKCYEAREAPVFRPTTKEFQHPARYIESIAEQVRPYGICKIIPPASWTPPFQINRNTFTFRTRVQQVNYLDGQARLRLMFVENLCRFMSRRGTPLERLPVVGGVVLDLCRLFREVRRRGGMVAVSDAKKWTEVSRSLEYEYSFGAALKAQYEKILYAYELHKAATDAPAGDAGAGGAVEEEDEAFEFGYHDGKRYTLKEFKVHADEWKTEHFEKESVKEISEDEVEEKYWKTITAPETMVEVEYGSELHTTTHGSGFPTCGNPLNPLDTSTPSTYTRSLWNLNNLNACTLLRYVKEDIPGIISPWVYVGMCFSTFCWHNEDHYLYSINYLWEGEPKQWYGVSGDDAERFEEAMRDYAPELFEEQPDLLFQLVTMIAPEVLSSKGIPVCRMRQRAGEFMLTFPRAYHGGFNMGFNVAESCNFALEDWIPWGRKSDVQYRHLARAQVFSHPGFLISLAEDDGTVHTAMWLADDLERYINGEALASKALEACGISARRVMEGDAKGILSNALTGNFEEDIASFFFGKRVCSSRMKKMNLSMADMRRKRDEDAVADECTICRGSTYLFQVACKTCNKIVGCVDHAREMCACPLANKVLETRLSEAGFEALLADVRHRANLPGIWLERASSILLCADAPTNPPKELHALVAEADAFPKTLKHVFARQRELRAALRQARQWSVRAQAVLSTVQPDDDAPPEGKKKGAVKRRSHVAAAEVDLLAREVGELKAKPEERDAIATLHASLSTWRGSAREAVQRNVAEAGAGAHTSAAPKEAGTAVLKAVLAAGVALRVEGPEHRNLRFAIAQQEWLDKLPAPGGEVALGALEGMVKGAAFQGAIFSVARVEEVRGALADAQTVQKRLVKALERGTSMAALGALNKELDAWGEGAAMTILIPEATDMRAKIAKCEAWSASALALLPLDAQDPGIAASPLQARRRAARPGGSAAGGE